MEKTVTITLEFYKRLLEESQLFNYLNDQTRELASVPVRSTIAERIRGKRSEIREELKILDEGNFNDTIQ